jgi:hypothetical protein
MTDRRHCQHRLYEVRSSFVDRTQVVAKPLGELTAARTAITASYTRLWRPAERTLTDPGAADRPPVHDREIGAAPEEHPPRDAGQ